MADRKVEITPCDPETYLCENEECPQLFADFRIDNDEPGELPEHLCRECCLNKYAEQMPEEEEDE